MNEIRTLMEKFWICRDSDKETFYKVKRDIPNFQRFIREQLGWKLIHTEKLLKLEKRPAHAEAFMGISEFTDIRDYCILCVVLMYLEDAEEGRQFLLSELIDYVETQLKNYMPVDWTSFTQRKSLVRVLQYMERLQMLRVYEGKSEFLKRHLVDNDNGEWFWGIRADGTVNRAEDKAGFWKCPYHNGRMCMEIMERF